VDMSFIIRQRLQELKLEQRDLAAAAQVTESYISQLLSRKKAPPAIERTGLYDRMDVFLEFPRGHLAAIAQGQRLEELKRKLAEIPVPLLGELRQLLQRKCKPETRPLIREIFEQHAFGELERLVSQVVLAAAKGVARDGLKLEKWMRRCGKLRRQSRAEFQSQIREFLDTDVVNLSGQQCSVFVDPLIESWNMDLKTFKVDIQLNRRLTSARTVRFQFVETRALPEGEEEPGLQEFLRNPGMSCDISPEELAFLQSLQFHRLRPSALYFYRELQSLRDPLHFPSRSQSPKVSARIARRMSNRKRLSRGHRAVQP
jgi:transcriptional regulator with XRE-family HTH domain